MHMYMIMSCLVLGDSCCIWQIKPHGDKQKYLFHPFSMGFSGYTNPKVSIMAHI